MTEIGGIEPSGVASGGDGPSGEAREVLDLLENDEIPSHLNRRLRQAADFCRERWENDQKNNRFVSPVDGSQWTEKEYKTRVEDGRPTWQINDIALAVHALSGQEVTGRFKPAFRSRPDDEGPAAAEALNVGNAQIRELNNAEHIESDAFHNLLIGGYSWLELYQDYLVDFRGRTMERAWDLWDVMWDPTARQSMLLDREWDAAGWWMSLDNFLALYPDKREDLLGYIRQPDGWVREAEMGDTARWPFLYRAVSNKFVNAPKREVFLVDYQWRQREGCWVVEAPVLDPVTGQMQPDPVDPTQPKMELKQLGADEWIEFRNQWRATHAGQDPDFVGPDEGSYRWKYRRAMVLGDKVLKEYPSLRRFSRVCMTGFPFRQMERVTFHGIVDYMRDPQKFKNGVLSLMTSMLQRSMKGGLVVDPQGFESPERLASDAAQPYPIFKTKPGALRAGSPPFQELSVSSYPSGMDAFLQLADSAVWRPTGLNPDVLGQLRNMSRVSGVVFNSLSQAGSTVLGYLFNSLKWGRQLLTRVQADLIVECYDEDYLKDLVGKRYESAIPPKAAWPKFFDRQILVDETEANTKDQRLEVFQQMQQQGTGEKLLTAGLMPGEIYADLFPGVTEPQRDRWKTYLEQRQEVADAQQQLTLLQTQLQIMQLRQQLQQQQAAAAGVPPPGAGGEQGGGEGQPDTGGGGQEPPPQQ